MLLNSKAEFDLAIRLRLGTASVGEAYSFISGLYFRGKLAYAEAFAAPPAGVPPALVLVPGQGLVPPGVLWNAHQLRAAGAIAVEENNEAFRGPLMRDAALLDRQAGPDCRYMLLGSIATSKYTGPLLDILGDRLLFPSDFVGRGDMSRGGLMLRCARTGEELSYVCLVGANRHGRRPAKLKPWSAPT